MLATVKIAPIERWCGELLGALRLLPYMRNLPGKNLQIETSHIEISPYCGGKWWVVSIDSANRNISQFGVKQWEPGDSPMVCEHMLEMD